MIGELMDKKLKKLFSDTAILGFGTFGSKLLVFFLMPFYTAWLSTSQYSTAELITSISFNHLSEIDFIVFPGI